MTSIDNTRGAAGFSASNVFAFITRGFAAVTAWNDARVTRKSLSKLSARELEDIGLTFSDIDSVATRGSR